MIPNLKSSFLAAAVVTAGLATQAHASFTYDLRFDPTTVGLTDTHDIILSAASPTTYTLQLWGQITGDTNLTNDGYNSGYVSIIHQQINGGAFTTGGIVSAALGTHVQDPAGNPSVGNSVTPTLGDGLPQWGPAPSTIQNATPEYLHWDNVQASGYPDGTTDAESHQLNASVWEVLLATFTVNVGQLSPTDGNTTFSVFSPLSLHLNNLGATADGLDYTQDGAEVLLGSPVNDTTVTFSGPEPASLSLLALSTSCLLVRRTKRNLLK